MALTTGNSKNRGFLTTGILYATFGFVLCLSFYLSDKNSLSLLSTEP